ncbi:MAG: molybdenum cofactor guanylyltransferase [Burkholderiaceae bacterium]|jgi:molybdopterin-guanine dinucleotide biosynthesis protein A|nr:molybdenum cofactor guanylyltransferase [Burkholderiaceae bacterium]
MAALISSDQITALVLSGGRGARMGGTDKGLQPFRGQPLIQTVLERLAAQTLRPAQLAINANRNAERYTAIGTTFGAPVWPDGAADASGHRPDEFPGPLVGILAGLERAATPYLLTVPCDVPWLPLSLCERLARALQDDSSADLAVALGPNDPAAQAQLQPMFCLLRRDAQGRLAHDLSAWLDAGERQARAWIARQRHVIARFGASVDDPFAFANANTPEQLQRLGNH